MADAASDRAEGTAVISRRVFVEGLVATGMGLAAGSAPSLPALASPSATPRYFALIVADGFRPDYMTLAPMPNLRALMTSGMAYVRAWVGQLESITPTGHATLSTGSMPNRDGVIGFEWNDPKTRQEARDGWPPGVLAGLLERDMHASGASSIPAAVKAANPSARVAALSSEKVYAADALGAAAADYVLFHHAAGPKGSLLVPTAVRHHTPPREFLTLPGLRGHLPLRRFSDWDSLSAILAVAVLESFRPDVLMVNLPGADIYGHKYGGPINPRVFREVVAGVDQNIGRIVTAYQRAGIFDQTLFVVTADHGMVPNDRIVSPDAVRAAVREAGGEYIFHTGGTAADIYIHNPWHSRGVAARMAHVPGVSGAYYRVRGQDGITYEPAPGLKIDPNLDDAFRYLLSTFAGPTSPHVTVPFRENTMYQPHPAAHGDHGGLNWGAQHIPLVISGPGVRHGVSHFPARLMGLPVPPQMDGIVLADALVTPSDAETARQVPLAPALTKYQDALIQQALDNISEDRARGYHPPPPLPLQP